MTWKKIDRWTEFEPGTVVTARARTRHYFRVDPNPNPTEPSVVEAVEPNRTMLVVSFKEYRYECPGALEPWVKYIVGFLVDGRVLYRKFRTDITYQQDRYLKWTDP